MGSVPGQAWSRCMGLSSAFLPQSLDSPAGLSPGVSSFYLPGFCFQSPLVPLGLVLSSVPLVCTLCAQDLRARSLHKCRVFGAGRGLRCEVGKSSSLVGLYPCPPHAGTRDQQVGTQTWTVTATPCPRSPVLLVQALRWNRTPESRVSSLPITPGPL